MRPISATLRIFFDDICSTVYMQLCFDMSRAKAGLSFPSCLCVFFVVSVCALVFVLFCVVFVIVLCFFLCCFFNVCCSWFLLFVFRIVCFLSFQLCVSKRPNWSAFLWSFQRSFCCLALSLFFQMSVSLFVGAFLYFRGFMAQNPSYQSGGRRTPWAVSEAHVSWKRSGSTKEGSGWLEDPFPGWLESLLGWLESRPGWLDAWVQCWVLPSKTFESKWLRTLLLSNW